MGLGKLPYGWRAERYPGRRDQILTYWRRVHARSVNRLAAWKKAQEASYSSGFPASCVAMAEESGHNSTAGYFGTIYQPSAYDVPAAAMVAQYGSSWLNWPYSAQLVLAQQLYAKYGGSAWGPLTRQKCGI